jgi:hypothetical protein
MSATTLIHGRESATLESALVSASVCLEGGHLAPVRFRLGGREVSPYSLSPWLPDESDAALPALLRNLRGDFWCMPFGPQENGPPHGETANRPWRVLALGEGRMLMEIEARDTGGRVEKEILLRDEETAVYVDHRVSGVEGRFNFGNHPILDLSALPEHGGRVTCSRFRWASVYPGVFSDPADGASQALRPGAEFDDLSAVPLAAGGITDLTRYPARPGNDDLVMMVNAPATAERPFAWTAAVLDGCVWFSLKDPAFFPATLWWLSNGGRSAAPWENRHRGRIGLEEVCSYFGDGLENSRKDLLADQGIATCRQFRASETASFRIVQAVAAVPGGFGAVQDIRPAGDGRVILTDDRGNEAPAAVDWKYPLRRENES